MGAGAASYSCLGGGGELFRIDIGSWGGELFMSGGGGERFVFEFWSWGGELFLEELSTQSLPTFPRKVNCSPLMTSLLMRPGGELFLEELSTRTCRSFWIIPKIYCSKPIPNPFQPCPMHGPQSRIFWMIWLISGTRTRAASSSWKSSPPEPLQRTSQSGEQFTFRSPNLENLRFLS